MNRGEPAIRFIRAVREYNETEGTDLTTVAFHLDEESDAPFVQQADHALAFRRVAGATQTGGVYVEKDVLLRALQAAGCDAVWAGWGFVSEDSGFAAMVADAGLVFLGPDAAAMSLLGDKIAAKDLAERSGVPILPWSKRAIEDIDDARRIAEQIGYPVIVKAAHAGGGRGIRFVMTPDQLEDQLRAAREETKRVTGDEIVFIERLVVTGRHLEVQCLCDRDGTVATFGVRDCSVQRRNQKIIEETPPPVMSRDEIASIEASAPRLMAAARYESAGTVEFLFDIDRNEYYFMEVNTRLQVEHPITEVLYGVDLVKGQIDVAFGHPLRVSPREPVGTVLEARLNAEDPDRDFAPSPGYVRHFRIPAGPGVRVDSGIEQGSTIPALFDSMVAKVIVHGTTRAEAIARLRRALRETRIAIDGGTTNKAFLLQLLGEPVVVAGAVHTKWVEAMLRESGRVDDVRADAALVAAAIRIHRTRRDDEVALFERQILNLGYPRSAVGTTGYDITLGHRGNAYSCRVRQVDAFAYQVTVDGAALSAEFVTSGGEARLSYADRRFAIQFIDRGDALQVEVDGMPCMLEMESGGAVRAPSPAIVLNLAVAIGAAVDKGTRLLSLEAMKMEMVIDAPSSGIVKEILVSPGQQVAAGEPLVLIDAAETDDNAADEIVSQPRIDFVSDADDPDSVWTRRRAAFVGIFLGYDQEPSAEREFAELARLASERDELRDDYFELLIEVIDRAVAVDTLFGSERLSSDRFARSVSWQEMVYTAFRYSMFDSDTLPEHFVAAVDRALGFYPRSNEYDGRWRAFHAMQRTQRGRDALLAALRAIVTALESVAVASGRSAELLRLLDELIRLNQIRTPALADACLHARYHLYEQSKVTTLRRMRSRRVQERIRRLLDSDPGDANRPETETTIIDASPYIVYELLEAYRHADEAGKATLRSLLARHMTRDRELERVRATAGGAVAVASGETTLVVMVGDLTELDLDAVDSIAESEFGGVDRDHSEIVVICGSPDNADPSEVLASIESRPARAGMLCVGVYSAARSYTYRTYRDESGEWREEPRRREFSPLFYRELRVERLRDFDLEVLYHSDSVFLLSATAHANARDERLFALATASESDPEVNTSGSIERVGDFDEVFMEAVVKMRSEQAHRSRRLFWNRILIHVRALIPLSAAQIKAYGARVVPRTRDLGLEKLVIFTRRKRWSEDRIRDLELLFLNISEDQFTLRSRTPSLEPYKTMDRYVSNVVRSRQRKNVYPYEVIKMITYTGYPVSSNVPRGDFAEYDIEVADDGAQRLVDVKDREYGRNASNVVFGVIRNQDVGTQQSYRRVIVLSDPTADMGSLAEGECRRIIAALDLAEKERIPVEWIPVSSGARIDMESGTENLDWTAAVVRRIVEFTQRGGEINVIVSGINVGAQSYWNAEATMLMHTSGLLIMTDDASMLLTGKKALDFSGSVSADTNVEIGGVERIMGPNGQAQVRVANLTQAYRVLFDHYRYAYVQPGATAPEPIASSDPDDRDVGLTAYDDRLGQGFGRIADIFSASHNPERKKPFDMRQLMHATRDADSGYLERWAIMKDAETAIAWETRMGGEGVGMIGIESRVLARLDDVPHDGPESWSGGTLFPQSSKKVARAINAWSSRLPVVVLANLSGFDGSPESLRKLQLEYGAEIGRAVVNFRGPIVFVVVARYHGGAYVVFSKKLNPSLTAFALEGSYASVLGGAPAAAVVFPRQVERDTLADPRVEEANRRLESDANYTQRDYDDVYRSVYAEKQTALGQQFDSIHDVERAKRVGSIDDVITISQLRPRIIETIRSGVRAR